MLLRTLQTNPACKKDNKLSGFDTRVEQTQLLKVAAGLFVLGLQLLLLVINLGAGP